jgi:hypothetical protein
MKDVLERTKQDRERPWAEEWACVDPEGQCLNPTEVGQTAPQL